MRKRDNGITAKEIDQLAMVALELVEKPGEKCAPVLSRLMDERDKMRLDAGRRDELRASRRRLRQAGCIRA